MITIGTEVCVKTDNGEKYGIVVARSRNPIGYPILTVQFESIDPMDAGGYEDFAERDVMEA